MKFQPGDIVVWESTDTKDDKLYAQITNNYNHKYKFKYLNSISEYIEDISLFELTGMRYKAPRLLTEEEKLELL